MIWLVRHGQTAFNAEGRIQGAKDSPLTALGEEQGRRLGQMLGRIAPKEVRIIASPLGRTQHTARIIREHGGFGSPIETDARLAEISLGEWDGMLKGDIRERVPDYDAGPNRWSWFFNAPGGDSWDALNTRLQSWLEEAVATDHPIRNLPRRLRPHPPRPLRPTRPRPDPQARHPPRRLLPPAQWKH